MDGSVRMAYTRINLGGAVKYSTREPGAVSRKRRRESLAERTGQSEARKLALTHTAKEVAGHGEEKGR